MSDVVVTLPRDFTWRFAPGLKGLGAWLAEGHAAHQGGLRDGKVEPDRLYGWRLGGRRPDIQPGDRVYVMWRGQLIGYAPLLRLHHLDGYPHLGRYELVRGVQAVAVTIPEFVSGFRGFRYRWWDRAVERPIANWHEVVHAALAGAEVPMMRIREAVAA